jgi:hypothetical protein
LLPAGAFAEWDLHPLESAALSRRTSIPDIGGTLGPDYRPRRDLCYFGRIASPLRSANKAKFKRGGRVAMSIADFRSRSVVIAIFVALASNSAFGQTHGISFGNEKRLEVFPVLFVPSDIAEIPSPLISSTSDSLYAQLEVAQKRYGILLSYARKLVTA